jgi:4,5-DOPA dioxygenase extradiol
MWLGSPNATGPMFLKKLGKKILSHSKTDPSKVPKAVFIISAHWETTPDIRITTVENHTLLYDFYGFPSEYYKIEYPAKGSPFHASKATTLLESSGFKVTAETKRGLDHGVFTPLLYMFPNQEIPVVAISLPMTKDPRDYFKLGQALAPLREEGGLILGAGYATHNLRVFQTKSMTDRFTTKIDAWAKSFVDALEDAVTSHKGSKRLDALLETYRHPSYKIAHPTPEHYAPLIVAAGAAGEEEVGRLIHSQWEFGCFTEDSFQFGEDV